MRQACKLARILAVLGCLACAAGTRWERPGGTEVDRREDETDCASLANRDYSVPAQRIMTGPGGRPADGIELVTVRDMDPSAFDECMRSRGYERVPAAPPA
jgi:hypothetical protein